METKVLNYRVIVKPDKQTGTGKPGYTAFCPTLGVADDADTIEQAIKNVRAAIKAYVNSLVADKLPVPAAPRPLGALRAADDGSPRRGAA